MFKVLELCPLNGGACNQKESIKLEHNSDNVFLDIPYDVAYEDYERKIIEVVKNNNIIPVIAKEQTKSSILMCKICKKIQCCNYGIADITYPKLNIFFELGLMYGTNKKCAILKHKDSKIPTDLSGIEYLEYTNTRELGDKLEKWIKDNVN